ncbi:hypothetical protein BGZ94_002677 [Podila epigama]|nr:hypothetical protein BGZ94_002677 [Podila epigama]
MLLCSNYSDTRTASVVRVHSILFGLGFSESTAHGIKENSLPALLTYGSENMKCLTRYARHFLAKDNMTELEMKHVYSSSTGVLWVPPTQDKGRYLAVRVFVASLQYSRFAQDDILRERSLLHQADVMRLLRNEGMTKAELARARIENRVYELVRYFGSMILCNQFDNKLSETNCVAFWFHAWTTMFGQDDIILVDIGELASKATMEDMVATSTLFGTVSQSGGRKTDCLVRIKDVSCGVTSFIELAVNEHKPMHDSEAVLHHQASKAMRINRSILAQLGYCETSVFLEAHGLTAKIYEMKVFDDIFGCSGPLGKISLPTNKYEMQAFLEGDSIELLFRYKDIGLKSNDPISHTLSTTKK